MIKEQKPHQKWVMRGQNFLCAVSGIYARLKIFMRGEQSLRAIKKVYARFAGTELPLSIFYP
ncbi:hypothetical protein LG326_14535 [Metaplanococcus flavidus]